MHTKMVIMYETKKASKWLRWHWEFRQQWEHERVRLAVEALTEKDDLCCFSSDHSKYSGASLGYPPLSPFRSINAKKTVTRRTNCYELKLSGGGDGYYSSLLLHEEDLMCVNDQTSNDTTDKTIAQQNPNGGESSVHPWRIITTARSRTRTFAHMHGP